MVFDKARPGKLALQYWFFYVYNHFNNLHEGDWEMIQLNFDAASARGGAVEDADGDRILSQHEGGERAAWGDEKLELVGGTHPVVYPAAGSHANHFSEGLFLGRNGSQGVGCDDTVGAVAELRPDVKTVPSERQRTWPTIRGSRSRDAGASSSPRSTTARPART